MRLDVFSHRWTLIGANVFSLAILSSLLITTLAGGPRIGWSLLSFAAPILALLAFVPRTRRRPLLGAAAATSLLLFLLSLPYLFFAVRNGIPFHWFLPLVVILFAVPLLTAIGCWLVWPRAQPAN